MATVAGSVMIAYVTMLQNQFPETNLIQHMITASVLSIPAAIIYSNIMIPEDDVTEFDQQKYQRFTQVQWMQLLEEQEMELILQSMLLQY